MLDAAVKALSQILSPPMCSILWRSIGLALILITALAFGLQRLLQLVRDLGEILARRNAWAELRDLDQCAGLDRLDHRRPRRRVRRGVFDAGDHLAGGSVFVDEVADHVELKHYPADRPGTARPAAAPSSKASRPHCRPILVY